MNKELFERWQKRDWLLYVPFVGWRYYLTTKKEKLKGWNTDFNDALEETDFSRSLKVNDAWGEYMLRTNNIWFVSTLVGVWGLWTISVVFLIWI